MVYHELCLKCLDYSQDEYSNLAINRDLFLIDSLVLLYRYLPLRRFVVSVINLSSNKFASRKPLLSLLCRKRGHCLMWPDPFHIGRLAITCNKR